MDSRLERKLQYAAAWCGPVFLVGYLISFGLLGHNHPPPSPAYTPLQLVEHYFRPYHQQIMVGMIICMVVGVFYLPWAEVMTRVLFRKEHSSPVLANSNLVGVDMT